MVQKIVNLFFLCMIVLPTVYAADVYYDVSVVVGSGSAESYDLVCSVDGISHYLVIGESVEFLVFQRDDVYCVPNYGWPLGTPANVVGKISNPYLRWDTFYFPTSTPISPGTHARYGVTVYIRGAVAPPDTEEYDFGGHEIVTDYLEDYVAELMYWDGDSWVLVDTRQIPGKGSILDPDIGFFFDSYSLPSGLTDSDFKVGITLVDGLGNPNGDTFFFDDFSAVAGSSSAPGTTLGSSGLENVPVGTNDALNIAVEFAAGIRLAKPDITDAVCDGVAGLEDAINNIPASGGGTPAEVIEDAISNSMGVDNGYTLDSGGFDVSGIETNIGGAAAQDSISSMGSKIESFVSGLPVPVFPQGLGSISTLSFSLGGSQVTLDFDQSYWATMRTMLEWMVHVLFFMGIISIVRRGIA